MRNENTVLAHTRDLPVITPQELLADAFKHFSEASAKLEARYEALRKETEDLRAELQQKDSEIKRTEKLATLGETAAAIAHEVRNPLGAIKLFVSLLQEDLVDRPQSKLLVAEIDKSINSLDHVVSNILTFSKSKPLQMGPVNVFSLVREMVQKIESDSQQNRRSISVVCDLHGNPYVTGNEHGLRQVLQNLTQNALQAMRYQGILAIRTTDGTAGAFKLTIEDSGPGINIGNFEKIFEPFYTTRNEGTGLGLAIVKRIVDEHGGQISVRNNPGAEFILTFPRSI